MLLLGHLLLPMVHCNHKDAEIQTVSTTPINIKTLF